MDDESGAARGGRSGGPKARAPRNYSLGFWFGCLTLYLYLPLSPSLCNIASRPLLLVGSAKSSSRAFVGNRGVWRVKVGINGRRTPETNATAVRMVGGARRNDDSFYVRARASKWGEAPQKLGTKRGEIELRGPEGTRAWGERGNGGRMKWQRQTRGEGRSGERTDGVKAILQWGACARDEREKKRGLA